MEDKKMRTAGLVMILGAAAMLFIWIISGGVGKTAQGFQELAVSEEQPEELDISHILAEARGDKVPVPYDAGSEDEYADEQAVNDETEAAEDGISSDKTENTEKTGLDISEDQYEIPEGEFLLNGFPDEVFERSGAEKETLSLAIREYATGKGYPDASSATFGGEMTVDFVKESVYVTFTVDDTSLSGILETYLPTKEITVNEY